MRQSPVDLLLLVWQRRLQLVDRVFQKPVRDSLLARGGVCGTNTVHTKGHLESNVQ